MATLQFTLPEKMPWYRYIGPWPMRPLIVFAFGWYFYLVTATGQFIGQQVSEPGEWFYSAIVPAIPAAAFMGLAMLLGKKLQERFGVVGWWYFLYILATAAGALYIRFLFGFVPGIFTEPIPLAIGIFRTAGLIFFTLAMTGIVTVRLQHQVDVTQRALEQVRDQQQLMLEADETARRQVSTLLHDRVQAGLIAACLELQILAKGCSVDDRRTLDAVIERLEGIRSLDVRRAARALSPNLQEVDLRSSLEELAAQYEPAMGTTVSVGATLDAHHNETHEIALAIYRIVEQALLNAATHGHARHCSVTVVEDDRGVIITVADDGIGVRDNSPQGTGSAILTTWVRLFDGDWTLSEGVNGGALVTARLTTTSRGSSQL